VLIYLQYLADLVMSIDNYSYGNVLFGKLLNFVEVKKKLLLDMYKNSFSKQLRHISLYIIQK
jgi:hypothetical protein